MLKLSCQHLLKIACFSALLGGHETAFAQADGKLVTAAAASKEVFAPLVWVEENGKFIREFRTLDDVLEKSRGNVTNRIARGGVELIYLNSRCDPAAGISYSMTRPERVFIDAAMKASTDYLKVNDFIAPNPDSKASDPERKKRERIMVDEILKILSEKIFLRKAECDSIPIMLSVGQYGTLLLELDDAQNPLVGPKVNDGSMYAEVTGQDPFVLAFAARAKDPNFATRYGYNRYGSASDAVNAARLYGSGDKLVIFDGAKAMVYRLGDFKVDYSKSGAAFEAQFGVFKTAKLRKGLTILAVVIGRDKAFKINVPPAAKPK